jgi:hypothetical protein
MNAHYLPRCYLRGFVEAVLGKPKRLWVRSPIDGSWERRTPDEVATIPNYYGITRPDGSIDQGWEDLLGRVESAVAPILRRIPKDDALSGDEGDTLITFAGTLYLRLPIVHETAGAAILPQLRSALQKRCDDLRVDPDAFRRSLEECARDIGDPSVLGLELDGLDLNHYTLKINREVLIDRTLRGGTKLIEILMQMRWHLLRPAEPVFFITSDRPTFFMDSTAPDPERHHLQSAGTMFSLPLTKEVLLLGDWGGPAGMNWARISTSGVREMNVRRTGPGLALYSPRNDFMGYSDLVTLEKAHAQRRR